MKVPIPRVRKNVVPRVIFVSRGNSTRMGGVLERGMEAEAVAVVVFANEKSAVLAAAPTIDAEGAGVCSFGAEFVVHGLEVVHGKSD